LDAVRHGETGLLVDPTSPGDLAAGLARIMTDPPFAQALATAGRRHAEAHAYPLIARQVAAALEQALP
jgi:phosphatidylinositol alpha-1,6-mannosyltransferase